MQGTALNLIDPSTCPVDGGFATVISLNAILYSLLFDMDKP